MYEYEYEKKSVRAGGFEPSLEMRMRSDLTPSANAAHTTTTSKKSKKWNRMLDAEIESATLGT